PPAHAVPHGEPGTAGEAREVADVEAHRVLRRALRAVVQIRRVHDPKPRLAQRLGARAAGIRQLVVDVPEARLDRPVIADDELRLDLVAVDRRPARVRRDERELPERIEARGRLLDVAIRHVEHGRVDGDTIVAETGLQAELEIAERLRAERYPRRRGRTRGRSAAAITLLIGAVDDGLVEQTVGKTEQPVD